MFSGLCSAIRGSKRIRTSNPRFRRPVLYPIEPWIPTKNDVAEKEGFEPSVQFNPHAGLANRYLRPLGHLSMIALPQASLLTLFSLFGCHYELAEEEGFEPPELSLGGFQDRCLRPLGHSSSLSTRGSIEANLQ